MNRPDARVDKKAEGRFNTGALANAGEKIVIESET
jgi:hypothetical protein